MIKNLLIRLIDLTEKVVPLNIRHKLAINLFKRLVLLTEPIDVGKYPSDIGICTIVGHRDVYFCILSLKSFFYFSKIKLSVFLVDGGLDRKDILLLKKHIRNIEILEAKKAGKMIFPKLRPFPYCYRYRREYHIYHNKKLFDPILLCGFKKFIYLDSDILFFSKPKELIDWVFSKDKSILYNSYTDEFIHSETRWGLIIVRALSRLWDSEIVIQFNGGLICSFNGFMKLPVIEEYLEYIYRLSLEDVWLCEQLAHAFLLLKLNQEYKKVLTKRLSPDKYCVFSDMKMRKPLWDKACIHYHSIAKLEHLYYDGIKLLIHTNLFRLKNARSLRKRRHKIFR